MARYVDYERYAALYGDSLSAQEFDRLAWEACRTLDAATTGVDGVKKLKIAHPVDEEDAEAVQRCACELVNVLYRLRQAEEAANDARGYIRREDGSLRGKLVSSVTAGNESVSYGSGGLNGATVLDKALADGAVRKKLFDDKITEYLSGVADANGVGLLYMGEYPYGLEE